MLTTQFFFSFYAPDFLCNITYLLNALQHISSWVTANVLTLNTSKTEFLLIRLKQQLAKIQNCTTTSQHSARNLGFIFDEHLTFSKSCYSHIRELRCIRPILISKQPIPSSPPLSTLNLTTVTHYTTTYLILS